MTARDGERRRETARAPRYLRFSSNPVPCQWLDLGSNVVTVGVAYSGSAARSRAMSSSVTSRREFGRGRVRRDPARGGERGDSLDRERGGDTTAREPRDVKPWRSEATGAEARDSPHDLISLQSRAARSGTRAERCYHSRARARERERRSAAAVQQCALVTGIRAARCRAPHRPRRSPRHNRSRAPRPQSGGGREEGAARGLVVVLLILVVVINVVAVVERRRATT